MTNYFEDIISGKEIALTVYMGEYLSRITLGLCKKMGLETPLEQSDCKIIAKFIRNHIHYQTLLLKYEDAPIFKEKKLSKELPSFMKDMEKVAEFFENAYYVISSDCDNISEEEIDQIKNRFELEKQTEVFGVFIDNILSDNKVYLNRDDAEIECNKIMDSWKSSAINRFGVLPIRLIGFKKLH